MFILYIILILMAYVLGSIPSAVWIGKKFYNVDVREHGSKNAGATNTLRVLGKKAALLVFAIDLAKGAVSVLMAHVPFIILPEYEGSLFTLQILLAAAAVIGHMLPIFAQFKGGKGVATIAGATLAIAPLAVVLSLIVFVAILLVYKYVSLASMTAGAVFPFFLRFFFGAEKGLVVFGILISFMLIYTHRKNIVRLVNGVENKTYIIKNRD